MSKRRCFQLHLTRVLEKTTPIISKNMGKHFLLTAYGGYLNYPTMENIEGYLTYVSKKSPWGKVELRISF